MGAILSSRVASLVVSSATWAPVTGGTAFGAGDAFQLLDPPPAQVGSNNQQQDDVLFAFNERQNVGLDADLAVDLDATGNPGTVPAGTRVSSHYVFFDPANDQVIVGRVEFGGTVLGVLTSRETLMASDFLGSPTTTYNSPSLRGLEPGTDSVQITGPTKVRVNLFAGSPGDYIRVVTQADQPLPAVDTRALVALAATVLIAGIATVKRREPKGWA